MFTPVVAFLRLTRPIFLLGGVVMYALGGQVARYEGVALDWPVYLLGQVAVTAVQLVGQYLNEYWDIQVDRLTTNRTLFSGGSGILAAGILPRRAALVTALVCAAIGLGAMAALVGVFEAAPVTWLVFLLALGGAWAYSSPPAALQASGTGELTTSLIVALLVPSIAYGLQTGAVSLSLVLAVVSLVPLHWAMMVAFEFPDYEADRATGKRTVLVRLGHKRTAGLHSAATLGAFALLFAHPLLGLPPAVAILELPMIPLVAAVVLLVRRLARGKPAPYGWLTFGAVSLFAVAAALEAAGYYVAAG